MAKSRKTPTRPSRIWPITGPIVRARLKPALLSAIAGRSCGPETISGTTACQAGAFMALPRPMQKAQRQQVPGGQLAEQGQHRQDAGHAHHPELADDDVAPAVEPVGQDAGEEAEQEHRQRAGRRQQRDEDRLAGEAGHLPGRPRGLHPAADVGQQVGDPQPAGRRGWRRERRPSGRPDGAGTTASVHTSAFS